MFSFLPIVFTSPWLLAGLALLPGLWWLLRATPPAPAQIRFPAIRLLYGLVPAEQTAAHPPWWLLLLRIVLAALLILGFAGPVWNPGATLEGTGPVVMVIDDGWAAAQDWPARLQAMRDLAARADRAGRRIVILPTAPAAPREQAKVAPATPLTAHAALAVISRLQPHPWVEDRSGAAQVLAALPAPAAAAVYWFSDGLDEPGTDNLLAALRSFGSAHVLAPSPDQLPLAMAPVFEPQSDLAVTLVRAAPAGARTVGLRVASARGDQLAAIDAHFGPNETQIRVPIPMPIEARNKVARIDIEGERTAGSVVLLDQQSRIPTIGIVAPFGDAATQPLLSARYYIGRALGPFGDLRQGDATTLLRRPLSMMVLTDESVVSSDEADKLGAWVEAGGVLLRFSGPNLAAAGGNPPAVALLPVKLQGDRSIGGAMSWETPAHLAEFAKDSPFYGLEIPGDVTVSRQVLAEPAPDLESKTWARLSDGTPLVTAEARGSGFVVLFHTTANAEWSNLALSGLFVDMLRRVASLGTHGAAAQTGSLAPWQTLDGFGTLSAPPPSAEPLDATKLATTLPGPDHPPGYYGVADQAAALNLGPAVSVLAPLQTPFEPESYESSHEIALAGLVLSVAAALLILDLLIGYSIRGLLRWAAVGLVLVLLPAAPSHAASDDSRLIDATGTIHLAYIVTGDPQADATAKAGLAGLSAELSRRTAVNPGAPMAIDLEHDDLIVFPLIYWAVTDSQVPPSPAAIARLNQYLGTGGVLLVDTRDQGIGSTGDQARLDRLLAGVQVPPLEPIPPDHVLTKSFYLLRDFPGRWDGGTLWVEPPDEHVNDGVSTLIVGSNDWAAAWAVDATGTPQFAAEPGGEAQREMAYRFGINLVMYALTGNYKSDQIHVRAILERLGR